MSGGESKEDFNTDIKVFMKAIRDEFLKLKMEVEDLKSSKASGSDEEVIRSGSSSSKNRGKTSNYDVDISDPKIKYPTFKGNTNPYTYLDWEMKFEQIFRLNDSPEEKKVKIASLQFTDYAIV